MTVEQLETFSNTKPELRYLTEEIIKYLGANPPGSPGGAGLVLSETVEITDAQFKNLDSVPVTMIAAPGVGKAVMIISWAVVKKFAAGAYAGTGSNANPLQMYVGNTEASRIITITANAATDDFLYTVNTGYPTDTTPYNWFSSVVENKAIELWSNLSNDMTGGNAANTLKVTVYYVVVDL